MEDFTKQNAQANNSGQGAALPVEGLAQDEKTFGMLAHLSVLLGFLIPFGNILGPLIIWLIKKDQSNFVSSQGKEALNFQITVTIAILISILLSIVLIGFLLMAVVVIGSLVFTIIAAIKANEGIDYRYPWALRLVK